jgi:large subunit ribosomal protein L14
VVQVGTKFKIIDNSGAKLAKCIKVLGKGGRKSVGIGNIILVTFKKFSSRKKVKKRTIYLGLIVALSAHMYRLDGTVLKFYSNKILVFNTQYKFLGTRVYGVISKELRHLTITNKKESKHFHKIISYGSLFV